MYDQKFKDRFNLKWKLDTSTQCWLWTASTAGKGYGQIRIPGTRLNAYAHRAAYEIHKGQVPEGKYVCHTCDNMRCVNPDHLWLGSCAENQQDMVSKGRSLYGERNPYARLTPDAVRKIRQLLAQGIAQTKIAAMFGIQQMEVSRIKTGKRWKHLE